MGKGGDNVRAVSAGLPNISGSIGITSDVQAVGMGSLTGTIGDVSDFSRSAQTTQKTNGLKLNASKSSSLYGKSATVQPPALQLIPQIRF